MINLLPPKEKKNLRNKKRKKMIIVLWFLAFFFVLCLILVLFAIKIYFDGQLKSQQTVSFSAKDKTKQEKIKKYREDVEIINLKLQKSKQFYENKVYFSSAIEKISLSLPDEIYLNDLSLMLSSEAEKIKVSLQGFSPSRELLFEFKNKLEEERNFINVSFPPSNWVKSNNINFSVSFDYELY